MKNQGDKARWAGDGISKHSRRAITRSLASPAQILFLVGAFAVSLHAAEKDEVKMDEAKLPPPAAGKVDFARDIKPILDNSCLRCHGPEKSKSKFRLDNRAAALKGGDKGVDIIPGKSAKSPLVFYVANLVEDMEMPPSGKGDPLTTAQVSLVRAWIDQGAAWETGAPSNNFAFTISPTIGGTTVSGDNHKFREHYWQKEGANGGIEQFESFEQLGSDTRAVTSGHALLDDYKITLDVDRSELGFIHSGWEQYRKYFDDTGGYYPLAGKPSTFSLNQDLHLDMGKAWLDFGLTLPNWPKLVLGYEYDYKKGNEALTSWGAGSGVGPNIVPVSRSLHEGIHILKFDVSDEIYGVMIENNFRGEFYRLDAFHTNRDARSLVTENSGEADSYFQGANTFRLEKQLKDWWFASGGYLYSKLNSDANFVDSFSNGKVAFVPEISLERESHVFNLNNLLGPFNGLTISTGIQSEWTREQGFGGGSLNQINTTGPYAALSILATPILSANYDESSVTENVAMRYTKIPFTVLFAEGRLEQQRIGQTENDVQPANPGGNYLQNTDFGSQMTDLRVGFNTSPWQRISLSAHYRRYEDDSRYNNDTNSLPPGGYPGFLHSRDVLTDEIESKLVIRFTAWLKTSLSFQYRNTDYRMNTAPVSGGPIPGGDIASGESNTKTYSINTVLTPWRRLYLSTTFSYQPSATVTENNNFISLAPYRGNIYSVIANATYVIDDQTDLFANYAFSEADFAQNNFLVGLPLGLEYVQHSIQAGVARRLSKNVSTKLLYGYNSYSEPSSGGALDYHSHTVFATLTFKLP